MYNGVLHSELPYQFFFKKISGVQKIYPTCEDLIYSASMKSYQYRNFDISENIKYSLLATVTFMFVVNNKLVWRDKTVTRALEL